MASTTLRKLGGPYFDIEVGGVTYQGLPEFAMFLDTHRDLPHIGSFAEDLHRGVCRPTLVHWMPMSGADLGVLIRATGTYTGDLMIDVHKEHRFLSIDAWRQFILAFMAENGGEAPVETSGKHMGEMPTRLLRDPRRALYLMRSFRQAALEYTLHKKGAP